MEGGVLGVDFIVEDLLRDWFNLGNYWANRKLGILLIIRLRLHHTCKYTCTAQHYIVMIFGGQFTIVTI